MLSCSLLLFLAVAQTASGQERQLRALTLSQSLELAEKRSESIGMVVLTGSVEPKASGSLKALGAIEFLLKAVDPDELYRVLCAILAPQELAG